MSKREVIYAFGSTVGIGHPGMELRDYMAIHAPNEMWAAYSHSNDNREGATWRYRYADEMLKAREETRES